MLITTTENVRGYSVTNVLGEVFGVASEAFRVEPDIREKTTVIRNPGGSETDCLNQTIPREPPALREWTGHVGGQGMVFAAEFASFQPFSDGESNGSDNASYRIVKSTIHSTNSNK